MATFKYDGLNTEVFGSCGMAWHNEAFVFGGSNERRQISKIDSNRLIRVGNLNFDHVSGGCANVADTLVYLCFNDRTSDLKKCRVASSPLSDMFDEMISSHYEHSWIRIAANDSMFLLI